MEVYIEYVIIDNLIIDLLLLYTLKRLLNMQVGTGKLVLSAVIGTFFAIVMPLISLNFYLLTFLKLIVGFVMIICLQKYSSVKEIIATFITFITITFAFGGVCFGVASAFGGSINMSSVLINGYPAPISLCFLIVIIFAYLFNKIIKYLKHKNQLSAYIYNIKLSINQKDFKLIAYLDTANELFDENNNPVTLLSQKIYQKIATKTNLKPSKTLPVITASSSSNLIMFEVDKLEIFEKKISKKNVKIAVANTTFKDYDCLLNKATFY